MLPLFSPVINLHDVLQKWTIDRRNWSTQRKCRQKKVEEKKVIILKVKLKLNVNVVKAGVINHRNADTASICETLDTQPEERSDGKFVQANEESGCDGKNWLCPRGSDSSKILHLKELSDIS